MLDHVCITGAKHIEKSKICQDFSWVQSSEDWDYLIVSDGCSSGGNTDLGARFLTLWSKELLLKNPQIIYYPEDLELALFSMVKKNDLNLNYTDYLATLQIVAVHRPSSKIIHFCIGDGVWGYATPQNKTICVAEYSNNTPFYLNYRLSPGLEAAWVNQLPVRTERLYQTLEQNAKFALKKEDSIFAFNDTRKITNSYSYHIYDKTDISMFFIATDGLVSFPENNLDTIWSTFFDFKSTTGQYLQRRVGAQTRNVWLKNLYQGPHDDLSIACILCNH